MLSQALYRQCAYCNKNILKKDSVCPHCGSKQKTSKIFYYIAAFFVGFFIIGFLGSGKPAQTKSTEDGLQKSVISSKQKKSELQLPEDEMAFISIIRDYQNQFANAKNELQESLYRDERKKELSLLVKQRNVNEWVGTIRKLETNNDGKAILSVEIAPKVFLKTWNNALSDFSENTLIEKSSESYKTLLNLGGGSKIIFSGTFFYSNEDFLREQSLTIKGAMKEPEFLFKFTTIKPIQEK